MSPYYFEQEEFVNRSAKLAAIRSIGIDPYPVVFHPTNTADGLSQQYHSKPIGDSQEAEEGTTLHVKLAGRLTLIRLMGKNSFAQLQDGSGRIQLMFNRDVTVISGLPTTEKSESMRFIEKKIDLGDIVGIEGHLFRTHKGELTVYVKVLTLLCKTLLPLPDKHKGLSDKETRYRKRWLDLISNPEVITTFRLRSHILRFIRRYCEEVGFIEVETPILQTVYGGAEARPFITELNALHQKMYLRIALEIPLKKLIIGGVDKVYEIGKVFRNEGIDRTHNPEFTMLEAYAAYWNYQDMMVFMERLFESLALELFSKTEIEVLRDGVAHILNLKAPWKRLSMKEALLQYANLDIDQISEHTMKTLLIEVEPKNEPKIMKTSRGRLIAYLFEVFVEPHLIQPHHIIDHPIETTPFCKLHRNPTLRNERWVERFESFILGTEVCNAYSELNDPELQRELLSNQTNARETFHSDEQEPPLDEEFLEAMCQGMPPTGGIGIGIDRMVMLFTKASSIKEVLFFPLMKPLPTSKTELDLSPLEEKSTNQV